MMNIIYAFLFGFVMKVSDLLADDGLKLFKFDGIFFGFLTGYFGVLLIAADNLLANIIFAMYLSFLLRNKLDHINHRVGAIIIFIGFASIAQLQIPTFYWFFLVPFLLADSAYDFLKMKNYNYYFVTELCLALFCFGFCLLQKYSLNLFFIVTTYALSYNLTKWFAQNRTHLPETINTG